jgi:ABC-type multidrug transport system ATPase subunit
MLIDSWSKILYGGSKMKNVDMQVEEGTLTITVDLSARHGKSGSGKTTIIATTAGNVSVPGHDDIKIGLNIYTK